jgi:hypothetical protein
LGIEWVGEVVHVESELAKVSGCTQITDFDPNPRHTVLKSRILKRVCIQIADAVQGTGA